LVSSDDRAGRRPINERPEARRILPIRRARRSGAADSIGTVLSGRLFFAERASRLQSIDAALI